MGVCLHTFGLPYDHIAPVAVEAERLGYDMIWYSEHLISPVGSITPHPRWGNAASVVPPTLRLLDPWVVMAHVAALTTRLRFGSSIYVAPLRHPIGIARSIASAQILSHGRITAGLGVGWLVEEYAAVGADFRHRGRNMDEIIRVLRSLWAGGTVTNDGPAYPFGPVDFGPPPPPIPIVLGGTSDAALRRAARYADGWILSGKGILDEQIAFRRRIDEMRAEEGRDHLPFSYHVNLQAADRDTLARYREAGFPNVLVSAYVHWRNLGADLDLPGRLDAIRRLADTLGVGPAGSLPAR